MSFYNSLCPKSTVYVPIVQFMSTEYGIFPQIAVNVHYMPHSTVSPKRTVYFFKVQFMSLDYTLCSNGTVYFYKALFMS